MSRAPLLLAAILAALLTALLPYPALAQDLATDLTTDLRGVIVNEEDGRPVPSAAVAAEGGPTILAGTDGSFRIRGPASRPVRLRVEQIGYAMLDTVVVAGDEALRLARGPDGERVEGIIERRRLIDHR